MQVMTQVERRSSICQRTWQDHRGTRFYKKDRVLVIKWCFNRVKKDVSGLTFQDWTLDVDTSRTPVTMHINSSKFVSLVSRLRKEVLRVWTLKGLFCHWMITAKKKTRVSPTPWMMRLKTLFRPLLDHHDRGISQRTFLIVLGPIFQSLRSNCYHV